MQPGGIDTPPKFARILAIAVVTLGALALGFNYADAQSSILGEVRKAAERTKGKAKQVVPRKGVERFIPKRNRAGPGGLPGKDAIGKARERLSKDRFPKDRDRLSKDRFSKDRLSKDGDRFSKEKVRDKLDKSGRDKLEKSARDKFDKRGRDKLEKDARGKAAKDRLAKDKLGRDKLAKDKLAKDKFERGKAEKGKFDKSKSATEKTGKGDFGKGKTAQDRKGKLDDFRASKSKFSGENTARNRLTNAKTFTERSRVRTDHRKHIIDTRLRLPPRPLPGQRGFTGVPPKGETRFVSTEMVFQAGPKVSRQSIDAQAKKLGLTVVGTQTSSITGGTIYHFRVAQGRQVPDVVRSLETARVGIAQPMYVFRITQETAAGTASEPPPSEQYVVSKLRLADAHRIATGNGIKIAVIDSKVDASHPDLAGAIEEQFDAVELPDQPHTHGTGMVGAISAHTKLRGIAPKAKILAVHAFSTRTRQAPEATTRQIIAGIDWAVKKGARVINMSFAGPYDPMIQLAMKNAHAKGVILIAAAGNLGAKSPPLYPAADPHVIAVTATDEGDMLFTGAVRGAHLAIAAPGVDILVPAPNNTYQLTTGTSVAAAHVSGVAALLLERHPNVSAAIILEVLTATARNLGADGRDDQFGWGLIDPAAALEELDSRIADGKAIAGTGAKPGVPKSEQTAGQKTATPKGPRPASVRPGLQPSP